MIDKVTADSQLYRHMISVFLFQKYGAVSHIDLEIIILLGVVFGGRVI